MKKQKGFSIIEVILASAIFLIFAGGVAAVIAGALEGNRLGEEQTIANQFASEGVDATRSISNQAYSNLINSAGTGLLQSGGVWTFSGSNNQFGPGNKYTRVITIVDVQRDGSGNIVASGGIPDSNTKKITSTVSWNAGPTRADSVVLTSYLTNWRASMSIAGGLIIYGDATTTPKFRTYSTSGNSFGAESPAVAGSTGRSFVLRTSPTKTEAIAGYVNTSGTLQVMCYDGLAWTNDWSVSVGGTGTTKSFDISYETNSGDVIVLYSTNTATTNELAFRTKPGSSGCGGANWASASNLNPIRTSGVVQWVKMVWDKRSSSNLITAIWADANRDLSAMVWSGSAWGNEPSAASETSLEIVTTAQDIDDFDVEYESSSGDVLMVWANSAGNNGTNGVRYRTCTGGTSSCTWNGVTTPPTLSDDATNLDIAGNPNTDEIVFGSVGNAGSDLQLGYWSGSAWTNTANADTSSTTPFAGSRKVAAGWVITGGITRSIITYDDQGAGNVGWYSGNGSTFTKETDFVPTPAFASNQGWYQIDSNPQSKDQLIFSVSDSANDLFSKRLIITAGPTLTWSNSDGSAALQTGLGQTIATPFSFAYWRN